MGRRIIQAGGFQLGPWQRTVKVCTFWPWQGNVTAKNCRFLSMIWPFSFANHFNTAPVVLCRIGITRWLGNIGAWETLVLTAWPLNGSTHQHNPGEFGYHRKLDDLFPGIRSQNGYPHWESTITACRSNGSLHSDLTPVGYRLSLHWLVRKMYRGFPLWNVSFTGLFS